MRLRIVCVLFLLLAAAPVAAADENDVRRLFDEGQALYDAGKYDEAVARWTEGFELSGAPAFLYNIAQAHRLAGRCEESLAFYRRFRDADPLAAGKEAVDRRIEEMDRCVAEHEEAARRAEPVAPEPAREIEPSPPPPPPASSGRTLRWVGIGLMATAAVAVTGSIYYGVDARDASGEVEDAWAGGTWTREHMEIEERGERSESRAVWLGVGAAALAGAGVALYWYGGRDAAEHARVTLSPRGVTWSARF